MGMDEFLHYRKGEYGYDSIESVNDTSTKPGYESRLMSTAQGFLNHKNSNRSDRGRRTYSNDECLQNIQKHIQSLSK